MCACTPRRCHIGKCRSLFDKALASTEHGGGPHIKRGGHGLIAEAMSTLQELPQLLRLAMFSPATQGLIADYSCIGGLAKPQGTTPAFQRLI